MCSVGVVSVKYLSCLYSTASENKMIMYFVRDNNASYISLLQAEGL